MDKDNKNKVKIINRGKNLSRKALKRKLAKRTISLVLSFAMLLTSAGVYNLSGIFEKIGASHTVRAAGKYEVADYTPDGTIVIDGVTHPYYELTTQNALILYSQSYYEHDGHTEDVIKIDIGSGTVTSPLVGYESIGNDDNPFNGRIYIGSSSYTTFNLNCPFFGTVSDSVQIYEDGTTTEKNITITRIADGIDEPLFARKVIHDDDASDYATWSVTCDQYSDGTNFDTYPFAGFIGTMNSNAQVTLNAVNNAVKANGSADISSSSNIGVLCQTMNSGASLDATYSGSNTSFAISTTSGAAGGFVGRMELGSSLTINVDGNPQSEGDTISTQSGYAGGIVGYNDGGTVSLNILGNGAYSIDQNISGTDGAGSVFGYYRPQFTNNAATFDINDYDFSDAVLEATTSIGGLFGKLENAASNSMTMDKITITTTGNRDTVYPNNSSTNNNNYGGLIGEYKANETADELIISAVKADITNNAAVANYGGAIGKVEGGSYVYFDDFTLSNATSLDKGTVFGGLVAKAEGAYIYAKDVVIGTSELAGFNGGGLVGSLGNGLLAMTGTINLSNAKPKAAADNGQIVGKRDNALIYAENIAASGSNPASVWNYTPSSVEVDNVGSWGDVIFFDGTTLVKGDVISSENNHVITFANAQTTNIDSVADYAVVSLLFQINPSNNSFINGTQLSDDVAITFTDDITLTGTGLRGITRDNGSTRQKYSGTITGGNNTVTLDIKNIGGNNRPVYYHTYNGLLGLASGVTVESLYLDGNIILKPKANNKYVGAFAATAEGTLSVSECKTLSTLSINITDNSSYVAGRFVGLANKTNDVCGGMNTINISDCEFDGTISGGGDRTIGGVFGRIGVADNISPNWTFDNITLKGSVSGYKSVGGLVAEVAGGNRATIKLVGTGNSATGVVADGLIVSGTNNDSMGGLLGYSWTNVDVEVENVSLANTPEVNYRGSGNNAGTAGLVYLATGHWTVTGLDLTGIKMTAPNAKNIGMIVNKGINGSGNTKSGIYLELPAGYNYSLSFANGYDISSVTVFDELCAYSADSSNNIMTNKQGIISVSTSGLKMESSATDSLSYKNQTNEGAMANPNSRYYYNLDLIDDDADLSSNPSSQFMSWGVCQYACLNINSHFSSSITFNSANTYDMKGYSWYPITLDNAVTVAGTFKFYNKEFTDCEGQKSTDNKWYPNTTSSTTNQHYMMQNGLFYNVNKNLTIGTVVLQGNIGATGTSGTGALVYGTVSGSSPAQNDITVIDSTSGSISLDGIKVWNFQGTGGVSANYAPLLINKTGSYVTLNISNVSTTSTYTAAEEAATSLIGYAGVNDTDVYITTTFTNIKLDARSTANSPALSSHGYNTTKSIFTKSTLLKRLVNETGTYTYSYSDDWGTGNHNVTYGKEVGYGDSDTTTQYYSQEQWYARSSSGDTKYATQYSSAPTNDTVSDTFKTEFLPYVEVVDSLEAISGEGTHYQLKVNHQPTEVIKGCGTYNDPYIITSEADLVKIYRWISGNDLTTATINANFGDTWCDGKSEHGVYNGSSSGFINAADSTDTRDAADMRRYLCEAYYKITPLSGNSITVSANSNFRGLGIKDAGYRFRGVIVGGDNISIINKTAFPLIAYSEGSVVKNLTVTVDTSDLYINKNNTYKGQIYFNGMTGVYTNWNNTSEFPRNSYGSVIATIVGGDNIIDNVQVNLNSAKFYFNGTNAQYTAIGGYVGVVIDGGLVFKNMSGSISGLTDNTKITNNQSKTTDTMINSDNNVWMFVNPIIGRVINGYAVTESSGGYKAREADVTMKNSTGDHDVVKNYSITDIATTGSTLTVDSSAKTIAVPDSQAFVLMSYIVNSGMGSNLLGYSKTSGTNYFMRRHAAYSDVGSTAAASSSCSDYTSYASLDSLSSTPYLIYKYAGGSAPIGSESWTVNLATKGDYDLSDGFRGIGNFFYNNDSLRLNISAFNGNGSTINQNTKYYYYSTDCSTDYRPYNHQNSGIALINCLNTNCSFSDFILTGSVKCDAILKDADTTNNLAAGDHIFYKTEVTNNDNNRHLSAAMLLATVKDNIYPTIDSVALQNVNVRGVRHTGGLIGNLIKTGSNIVKITNEEEYDSYGITVHGAGSAAGLIGRNQEGLVQVDLKNCHFNITEIVSECSYRADDAANGSNTNKSDYNYGVAGFIGICRSNTTSATATNNKFENIKIGTPDLSATVQSTSGGTLFTGGVIGVINKANVTVNNCEFYNLTVNSNYVSGGLVADCITGSTPTVKNTKLISNKGSVINAATSSGGFIGNTDERGDGGETFVLRDSEITGYTISATTNSGGIIGYRGAKSDSAILQIENVKVSDCTIKSNTSAGVLAGEMLHPIYGYNINCNDVVFSTASGEGNITNNGYIVGLNTNSKDIKIAGFSRSEDVEDEETSTILHNMVGNNGTYGSSGYVVFADYNGDCLGTAGTDYSNTFSTVNNNNNVTITYKDAENNLVNFPYVTSSTPTNIGDSKFLTSDGVSSSAYTDIADDITNQTNGYYSFAASNLVTQSGYIDDFTSANAQIASHLSTYQEEMGDGAISGIDFPMLVVDDVTKLNTTALINDYIRLLTNTNYTYNYINNSNDAIFDTKLCKCTYSADGSTLTINSNSSCLKMDTNYFYMTAGDTDTASETPQFSLIDVQFKNPSDTSKVAYHLYVPVYVRKLLEYDFEIKLESGTDYVPESNISGNTLLENLGAPVTAEFRYTYNRTAQEWQTAMESGDDLLNNYPKKLQFVNSSLSENGVRAGFEKNNSYYDSNTKMVLVDSQKGGKAYYCDNLTGNAFSEKSTDLWILDLQQFADSKGNDFAAVPFNDLMTITATADNNGNGKFVCVEDAGGTATVRDNSGGTNDGKTFRIKGDSDSGSLQTYNIVVSDALNITEHYFLSIYTQADYEEELPVYHYTINSPNTLGNSPYPSRANENESSHLLIGDIYENSLTIEPKTNETDMYHQAHRYGDDYAIEATMTSTVRISDKARTIVGTYLGRVNTIEIYQSFLTTLNMRNGSDSEKGIKAIKDTDVTNYRVGGTVPSNIKKSVDSNFAEFKNNYNLRQKLAAGDVIISADIKLIFDDEDIVGGDDENNPAQFYPGPANGIGTTLIGYSNIASNKNKTEYSKVSNEVEDTARMYYYNSTETCDFEYNAYADNEIGLYGKLGINANELDENPVPITTLGIYDVSKFQTSAATADYIKIDVELLTIDNDYATTQNIGDYLTDLTFVTSGNLVSSDTTNPKKWTYLYPKNAFAIEAQTYQIPINYSVYTGDTNEFEGSLRKYSNYEVRVTVSMYEDDEENVGNISLIANSEKTDYIKYTNARIFTGRVNPNK